MKYVERVGFKMVNHLQKAISYVEMDDRIKAINALRELVVDIQELIAAATIADREQAS